MMQCDAFCDGAGEMKKKLTNLLSLQQKESLRHECRRQLNPWWMMDVFGWCCSVA
jgi:hypothetical protein